MRAEKNCSNYLFFDYPKTTINKYKKMKFLIVFTLLFLIININLYPQENQNKYKIFILNSYNKDYVWTENMINGIEQRFSNSGLKIDIDIRFMDMKRIPYSDEYFDVLNKMLYLGYNNTKFDAVMACDNDAFNFIRKYRDELFPGVPVVFVSINDFDIKMLEGRTDITGTSENTDYFSTINIGLNLFPKTKNIYVVVDGTSTGLAHRRAVEKIIPLITNNVSFQFISFSDFTMEEMGQKLKSLDKDSIVLLLHHFQDKKGIYHTVEETTPYLAKICSVPCFVQSYTRMGFGVLGGDLVNGYTQGQSAANMVISILKGTKVEDIPVLLKTPNQKMFDYNVMKRFGISLSDLPEGSLVINKPQTFFANNKKFFITLLIIIMFLSLVVVFLILLNIQKNVSSKALRDSESRIKAMLYAIPDLMFLMDREGVFLDYKADIEDLYAQSEQTIIGKKNRDIAPSEFADLIEEKIKTTLDTNMLQTFEYQLPIPDRGLRDYEARMVVSGENEVTAIVRDITEQKNAETALRESEKQYKELIDGMNETVWIIDFEGNLIDVNKTAVDVLGYTKKELISIGIYGVDSSLKKEEIKVLAKSMSTDKVQIFESTHKAKDGRVFPVEIYSSIVTYHGKKAILSIARDITERKQAEARLTNAMEMAHLGHWEYDVATDLFTFNDQFYKIFNTTAEQVGGYTMHVEEYAKRFLHPDDMFRVGEETRKALETTDPNYSQQLEHRIICPDGTIGYICVRIFIIKDSQGRTIKTFGVNQNITDLKKAEKDLREKTALLEAQLNSSIEGILVVDSDGKKILQNKRTVELWEIPQDIADNPDDELQIQHVMQMTKNPELFVKQIKYLYSHPDEVSRDEVELINDTILDRYSAPVIGDDGKYYGRIWAFRDITENKKTEEEIIKLNKDLTTRVHERTAELLKINSELESFSYSVSHDLRAPLRHISSFTDLLYEEIKTSLNEVSKKYFNNIISASKKMNALIDDLLAFSRMSRNSLEHRKVNMNILVEEVIHTLSDEIKNRDIKWILKDLPQIKCDIPMIKQVFINLLQNAIKYSKNVEKAEIEVGYQKSGKNAIFYIKDNGVGFDEKYKDKLFGVFQRLHSDKEFSGTGIGLALVKKIINRHGGSVWAEGKINEGATFYFSLPK